jgi:hypothetical protein
MPFITRNLLPRYRVNVPKQLQQLVPTVYLGMPPLGIGTSRPSIGGEPRHAYTANLRGTSVGGASFSQESQGPSIRGQGRKRSVVRAGKATKSRRRGTSSNGIAAAGKRRSGKSNKGTTSGAKAVNVKTKVIRLKSGRKVYMRNGKFVKKGG